MFTNQAVIKSLLLFATIAVIPATGSRGWTDESSIAGLGVRVAALPDSQVEISNDSGGAKLLIGAYRLAWSPQATAGGTASLTALPAGGKALQVSYNVKGDPAGQTRIQSLFSVEKSLVHIRFDIWGPDDLKTGGAMLECAPEPQSQATTLNAIGLWQKAPGGGMPFQTPGGNLIAFKEQNTTIYVGLHGNPSWQDGRQLNFPAKKAGAGHYVAEGDVVFTPGRPSIAGAVIAGLPLGVDAWTDQPYNLWTTAAKPIEIHTETMNLNDKPEIVDLDWKARDFDGKTVAAGKERRLLGAGQIWDRNVDFPAPPEGILFVEASASNGVGSVFTRTNAAVLPNRVYLAQDDSLFGLSAFFPLPSKRDAQQLIKRIGVRWLRSCPLTRSEAEALAIDQNNHSSLSPNDAAFSGDQSKVRDWIARQLTQSDQHGARYWEICNEWNMAGGIGKGVYAGEYVDDILAPADSLRRQTGASVKLMSVGLAGADTGFIDKMYAAGAWEHFDALALHPGRGNFTPDFDPKEDADDSSSHGNYWSFLGSIRAAKSRLARYGEKPLWITEAYACTQPNSWWHDTPRHAAENVVLSYAIAAAEGVQVMDWYQLNDGTWYDQSGVDPKDPEYSYGLLNQDLSPKPSLLAYATIAGALDQAKFVKWLKFRDNNLHGLQFATPRGSMEILWSRADGYLLNGPKPSTGDWFASPEPWVDDWKTKATVSIPAAGPVEEIDCIGRTRRLPVKAGVAQVTLDGAPRIFYGLSPDDAE